MWEHPRGKRVRCMLMLGVNPRWKQPHLHGMGFTRRGLTIRKDGSVVALEHICNTRCSNDQKKKKPYTHMRTARETKANLHSEDQRKEVGRCGETVKAGWRTFNDWASGILVNVLLACLAREDSIKCKLRLTLTLRVVGGGENTHTHTYTQRKSEEKVRCNHIVPKLVSSEQERKEKGNKNQNKSRSSSSQKKIKPIPRAKAQLHGIPQWTRRFRQNHSGQCSPHLCQARWVAVAGSGTQPSRFLRLTCYQEQQPKESRCLQNNNQVAVYRLVGS